MARGRAKGTRPDAPGLPPFAGMAKVEGHRRHGAGACQLPSEALMEPPATDTGSSPGQGTERLERETQRAAVLFQDSSVVGQIEALVRKVDGQTIPALAR